MTTTYYITGNIPKDKNSITELITKCKNTIILSNKPEQIQVLGIMLIHYCFEYLKKEFPSFIKTITLDVGDNLAALCSAQKIGYENNAIKHNFKSQDIRNILDQ